LASSDAPADAPTGPGCGDQASLVSAANGTIVLETTNDADGMIMLHVHNFAQAAAPARVLLGPLPYHRRAPSRAP